VIDLGRLLIDAGAHRSDDQKLLSKNCITHIVVVIQPVCTAYLIKDRHQSSPTMFTEKLKQKLK
jgi:hypothetical protein